MNIIHIDYTMAAFKLKSDTLELLCRTCLKINKIRFNIFESLQNEKLISTMLMDCLPIRIQEDDGFPVNICSNCLEKLSSACHFKTMAMQSDAKLHHFYQSKVLENENELQNNESSMYIKEERTALKSEQIDPLCDLAENINCNDITHGDLTEEQTTNMKNIEKTVSVSLPMQQSKSQNNIYVNNIEKNHNVEKSASLLSSNDKNKTVDIPPINNDYKKEDIEHDDYVIIENNIEKLTLPTALELENSNTSSIVIDSDVLVENESTKQLNGSSDDLDHSSVCSYSSDEPETENKTTKTPSKPEKKNKGGTQDNFNQQHAQLLNNPDYKRIIESGLSKKERNRATVYCRDCDKTVKFSYFVSVHAYMHTGARSFKCEKCSKCFPRQYILKQHMRIHSEIKDFSCDICGKSFTTLFSAQQHKSKHSEERPHACNICGKSYKCTTNLWSHLKTHNENKNFVCELCGKPFRNNGHLARHKQTHNTGQNFVCTTCGKTFKSQRNLNEHVKRHSDDKRYACSYCDKRFKCHDVLKNHILIHTGEKPFTCNVCDKKFRQRPSLRYHMRTHTGETPYDCEFCLSKFKYKHHLLNHMKVHKNEHVQKENSPTEYTPVTT